MTVDVSVPCAQRRDCKGPFAAVEGDGVRCLFAAEQTVASRAGVYLWSVERAGEHRALYVGQTRRSFAQRLGEHVDAILTGKYDILDLSSERGGRPVVVWRCGEHGRAWPHALPRFLEGGERYMAAARQMVRGLRFHVAELDGDGSLLDRVEGSLGRHFKHHEDVALQTFFGPGIQLPAAIPGAVPLRLEVTSEACIAGLPGELRA